jgi:hypothetical protein
MNSTDQAEFQELPTDLTTVWLCRVAKLLAVRRSATAVR